ncbi:MULTISPECIES: NfeD family protein [unclassified Brevundimonas]|uniref:NfeD family protein n=1 Tax=unclassified Brevundimonas TaxID=2622653 RepID=UPI0025C268C3|nr:MULTISPECIES: NfeD family protein [unclassified Brevundimonas]
MEWLVELYASQPFWLWLGIGVALLGVEAMFSTEWLLWPAVAAGITALLSALMPELGIWVELAVFAALTVFLTLISKRFVKKVNPDDTPDINDINLRLIGQMARVVEPFHNGAGRVFISGSEWAAEIDGASPLVGENVVVEQVMGGRLRVRHT